MAMAVLGAVGGVIVPVIQQWLKLPGWRLPYIDWKHVLEVSCYAAGPYLIKNFLTPTPKEIQIDPLKTVVVDKVSKEVISNQTLPDMPPFNAGEQESDARQ